MMLFIISCSGSKKTVVEEAPIIDEVVDTVVAEQQSIPPDTSREARVKQWQNQRLDQLSQDLGLSEEQRQEYAEIQDKYMKEMQELRSSGQSSRFVKMEEMKALREAQDKEIKKLFTEEQYAKFLEQRQKRKKG